MQFFEIETENILNIKVYYDWEKLIKYVSGVQNKSIFKVIEEFFITHKNIKSYLNKVLKNQESFNNNVDVDLVIFTDPQCLLWEYILKEKPRCVNIYFNYFKCMYSDSFFLIILKKLLNKNPKLKVYLDGNI